MRRIAGRGIGRRERARIGVIDDLARGGRRFFRQDLAEPLVEPVDALGQPLALGIARVMLIEIFVVVSGAVVARSAMT